MSNPLLNKNTRIVAVLAGILLAALTWSLLQPENVEIRKIDPLDTLVTIMALGLLLIQPAAGFPGPADDRIGATERWWIPLSAGIFFGLLDLLTIKVVQHPQPYTSMPPFLQPFPYSLFLYSNGAIYVEVLFRLIPLTIFMGLVTRFTSKRLHEPLFILIAVLTSLYEPIDQFPVDSPTWFRIYAFSSGFMMNYCQASFFRSYGFLASLAVRAGHYLIWHIGLGLYVQFIELAP